MEVYREMVEIPWPERELRVLFHQPDNPCFWRFTFGVNHGDSGTYKVTRKTFQTVGISEVVIFFINQKDI